MSFLPITSSRPRRGPTQLTGEAAISKWQLGASSVGAVGAGPWQTLQGGTVPWGRYTAWRGRQHTQHTSAPPPPSTYRLPEHPDAGKSQPRDGTAPLPHLPPIRLGVQRAVSSHLDLHLLVCLGSARPPPCSPHRINSGHY